MLSAKRRRRTLDPVTPRHRSQRRGICAPRIGIVCLRRAPSAVGSPPKTQFSLFFCGGAKKARCHTQHAHTHTHTHTMLATHLAHLRHTRRFLSFTCCSQASLELSTLLALPLTFPATCCSFQKLGLVRFNFDPHSPTPTHPPAPPARGSLSTISQSRSLLAVEQDQQTPLLAIQMSHHPPVSTRPSSETRLAWCVMSELSAFCNGHLCGQLTRPQSCTLTASHTMRRWLPQRCERSDTLIQQTHPLRLYMPCNQSAVLCVVRGTLTPRLTTQRNKANHPPSPMWSEVHSHLVSMDRIYL